VAELADAPALGAGGRKAIGVQIPSPAPDLYTTPSNSVFYRIFIDDLRDSQRSVGEHGERKTTKNDPSLRTRFWVQILGSDTLAALGVCREYAKQHRQRTRRMILLCREVFMAVPLKYPVWQNPYLAAMLGIDSVKTKTRIAAAETAIHRRMVQSGAAPEERQAVLAALNALGFLKRCAKRPPVGGTHDSRLAQGTAKMSHKDNMKKSDNKATLTLASLKREMAMPRIAKSVKMAELKLDLTKISKQPSISMPGTVEKIVPAQNTSEAEKVDISIAEGHQPSQALRIENTLTDEHGDEVRLKRGAHVDITITDETKAARRNS